MCTLRLVLAAAFLATTCCSPTFGDESLSAGVIRDIVVSPTGKQMALIADLPEGVTIQIQSPALTTKAFTIGAEDFRKYMSEATLISLEWSPGGEWLTLRVTDGDDSRVLLVNVNKGAGSLTGLNACGKQASMASWLKTGERLVVVPAQSDTFRPPPEEGLYVVPAGTSTCRQLTKGMRVTAQPVTAQNLVITKVQIVDGDVATQRLVAVDIDSGRTTEVVPYRSTACSLPSETPCQSRQSDAALFSEMIGAHSRYEE